MPGYAEPNADGKVMIYDAQGCLFPTGQVWPKACKAIGDRRFRIEFDDNNRHVMSIPGVAEAGNYLVMLGGPGGIQLSVDSNVTFEHIRAYCGGAIWGFHYGEARFTNLRGLRRPSTNRLFAGGTCYQVRTEPCHMTGKSGMLVSLVGLRPWPLVRSGQTQAAGSALTRTHGDADCAGVE